MKCRDCEHFHIRMNPWKSDGVCWDMGLAECRKHNLVVDFLDKRKLNKLTCVEDNDELRNE